MKSKFNKYITLQIYTHTIEITLRVFSLIT